MTNVIHPFQLLANALVGCLDRRKQAVINYLVEENRVLKDLLDGQRVRFTDKQRKRLAIHLSGITAGIQQLYSKMASHHFQAHLTL